MANIFSFEMQESFLTSYAEYLKQLKAMHPEKTFAVQISVDLLPDGIGYEIRQGPNISIMEVDEQGKSKPVDVTLDPTGDIERLARATEIEDSGDIEVFDA